MPSSRSTASSASKSGSVINGKQASPAGTSILESQTDPAQLNVEEAVRERYSEAARDRESALCCPVDYNPDYLKALPPELIERDYGCGDPSRYVRPGEVVLDLGCGGGKICYIASQVVGSQGQVIGVDRNDDMLALARKYQHEIGQRLGFHNTRFVKGSIQDLALDLEKFEAYLADHPVAATNDWLKAEAHADRLRATSPLIENESIDLVVSNCVLNLVAEGDRGQLFAELHRVLKRGGRAVISDIVCDERVPDALKQDPRLWSGCLSGAYLEADFLHAFAAAGFYGIEILDRQHEPWAVIDGIEFRSLTVRAFKGKEGPCKEHLEAVIYRGPFRQVTDDDGHVYRRGERAAVCRKTYEILSRSPYAEVFFLIEPAEQVDPDKAANFDPRRDKVRQPRETKGENSGLTTLPDSDCCGPSGCC